jgi:hypothetical protein
MTSHVQRQASERRLRNLHIAPQDPATKAYRRNAIAGMRQAQEAQIQKAYAAWQKEKKSDAR